MRSPGPCKRAQYPLYQAGERFLPALARAYKLAQANIAYNVCCTSTISMNIGSISKPKFFGLQNLIRTVPGFSAAPLTAATLISEISVDMSVFPSAKHLVSWASYCPRNDQSSKKVKSTRISRAGAYLKPLLVQVANAVIKSDKYPECRERYRRIKARRGHKKAIIAVCGMLRKRGYIFSDEVNIPAAT